MVLPVITATQKIGGTTGIVGKFISRIFKKPQTKDGFGKFISDCCTPGARYYRKWSELPSIQKFINRQAMTIKEKSQCSKLVLQESRNWTKAQKKSLQQACSDIRVITEPISKPVEVHTVSTSYKPQTIEKSRDVHEVVQAGLKPEAKTIMYVGLGISALLLLSKLLGGSK